MDSNDLFYYIDESGKIDDKVGYFILGCIITDDPDSLRQRLNELSNDIMDNPYYGESVTNFIKQGFHASENHPDIRTEYYKRLPSLNFRYYSVIIAKHSKEYEKMRSNFQNSTDLYNHLTCKLLKNRLLKHSYNNNKIIFEQIEAKDRINKINHVINDLKKDIYQICGRFVSVEVEEHGKDDILLSITDYLNFLLYQILHNPSPRMDQNFRIIEPKIAELFNFSSKIHYSEKNRINFEEIKDRSM